MEIISNYVEVISYQSDWLLWNKLNGILIQLEKQNLLEEAGQYKLVTEDSEITAYFQENQFFATDSEVQNEIRRNAVPYENYDDVVIVISVTEKCNCACQYCYQRNWKKKQLLKDNEYLRILMDYFTSLVYNMPRTGGKITIRFFGGEPLLKIELINSILNRLATLIQDSGKDIKILYEMDSNCLLLSREVLLHFSNLSIATTLTLKNDHNLMRSGSFEQTIANLLTLKDLFELPQYSLNVTYNVHHNNIDGFEEFLRFMKSLGLKCHIHTANVENYKGNSFENKLTDMEYENLYTDRLAPLLIKYGYTADDLLPDYGCLRKCHALNRLSRKFYSNGTITACSFFDPNGQTIRFDSSENEIFYLPEMCIKCYDYPYCGGKRPCMECDGTYKYRELMRKRIIKYTDEVE